MADLHTVLVNLGGKLGYTEGHSIAIHKGLDLEYTTGAGLARVGPDVAMTSEIRMDVLSMSKTITAAGVVRQLISMGLNPQEEKIGPHLPGFWFVHPEVFSLTFAHVLTHSGGLRKINEEAPTFGTGSPADYFELAAMCAKPPAGKVGTGEYRNVNYSLLRVLLAYLDAGSTLNQLSSGPGFLISLSSALAYVSNIQKNILAPSGVTAASIGPESPTSLQAEWFKDNKGDLGDQHDLPNAILLCGSDFWNMNVREYGRFIAHLINGQLHPDPWPMMSKTRTPGTHLPPPKYPGGDARLGVWRFEGPDGSGNYFGHNGGWTGSAFTGWMAFDGGVNVAFFANSALGKVEQEKMILDSWLNI
jgi:CubicO group peptidase (beta-lactamase class C family)